MDKNYYNKIKTELVKIANGLEYGHITKKEAAKQIDDVVRIISNIPKYRIPVKVTYESV